MNYNSVETSLSPSSSEFSSPATSPLSRKFGHAPNYSYVPPLVNGIESSSSIDVEEALEVSPVVPSTNNGVNEVTPKTSIEASKFERKMVTKRRKKTKRCGTCQGCRADFCGTCLYCANHRPESRTLCVVRRCKNKIVTERQSKTNFKQKVKTVRCGKCTGCRAESCGQCLDV